MQSRARRTASPRVSAMPAMISVSTVSRPAGPGDVEVAFPHPPPPVVRQLLRDPPAHPGAVAVASDRDVEGELPDPYLAELLGQIAHKLIDRGRVGVAERV